MSRLNILFITTWYPHENNIYQGTFVKEHAKAVALYHNVSVIFAYKSNDVKSLYEVNETTEDGIRTYRIKYRSSPIPKTNILVHVFLILKFFNKLHKEGNKFDLIHAHVFWAGVSSSIISMLYKIPYVLSEHYSGISLGILSRMEQVLLKFALKHASYILPVSDSLRKDTQAYGGSNKFVVIPNPIDTNQFYPLPQHSIRENGLLKRMLFVGSLEPVKGLPYLLNALSQIARERQDLLLSVVGDGSMRSQYERLTEDLNISHLVNFLGKKSKEEVANLMRTSDFLVSSSEWETLGCVLLEALASGIPVIAPRIGGIPEIVTDSCGILVQPRDIAALASAITNMLDTFDQYDKNALHEYVDSKFSLKSIIQQTNRIYALLIGVKYA